MVLDPVLVLVTIERLTKIDWKPLYDQEWFLYSCNDGKIVVWPAEPPSVHRSVSGVKVREGGQLEVKAGFRDEFTHRGMSTEYAQLLLRRYLADGTVVKAIPTRQQQEGLAKPASLITSAARADPETLARSSPSSLAIASGEED